MGFFSDRQSLWQADPHGMTVPNQPYRPFSGQPQGATSQSVSRFGMPAGAAASPFRGGQPVGMNSNMGQIGARLGLGTESTATPEQIAPVADAASAAGLGAPNLGPVNDAATAAGFVPGPPNYRPQGQNPITQAVSGMSGPARAFASPFGGGVPMGMGSNMGQMFSRSGTLASLAQPSQSSYGKRRMRAPNGEEQDIPENHIEHFLSKGARFI